MYRHFTCIFVRVFVEDEVVQSSADKKKTVVVVSTDRLKKSEVLAERKSAVLNENVFHLRPSTRPKVQI